MKLIKVRKKRNEQFLNATDINFSLISGATKSDTAPVTRLEDICKGVEVSVVHEQSRSLILKQAGGRRKSVSGVGESL